jgi:hypothetical protein
MDDGTSYEDLTRAIVDLHAAMTYGFSRVDARFDRMDARFDRMDARFDGVEARLTSVEGEVRGMRFWRDRVDRRLASLESR